MNNRKTVAVCMSGYDSECESQIADGIKKRCKEKNINVQVFSALLRKLDYPLNNLSQFEIIKKAEAEIYNLINYRLIDGLILLGNTICSEKALDEIQKKCRLNNVPFVMADDISHKAEHNIYVPHENAMEKIVEHLVVDHKLTRIDFIAGFPDIPVSEERIDAYKKVLRRHDIPVEDKRIKYGHFWEKAVDCAREFLKDEVPEAIVCSNDSMAIFVMDYLKSEGYRIPEDIIVTGYDGIPESDLYSPSITTVKADFFELGEKSVDYLYKLMNGNDSVKDVRIKTKLLIKQSCGCHPKSEAASLYLQNQVKEQNYFDHYAADMLKANNLSTNAKTEENIYDALKLSIAVFNFKRAYICLNSRIVNDQNFFYPEQGMKKKFGLSSYMISLLQYGHNVPAGKKFPVSELLPENFLEENETSCMNFYPLYFRDNYLGYFAFELYEQKLPYPIFNLWIQNAANTIGSYYIQNELEALFIRDPLTDLYNRRGMNRMFSEKMKEYSSDEDYVTVVCGDLDHLKQINDRYGHEGGDNAILRIAIALKKAFSRKSVCVRTGGDEYCVLYFSHHRNDVEKLLCKVKDYLSKYNSVSNLPYNVSCSFGYVTKTLAEKPDLEEMQLEADAELYKAKASRKKQN